MLVLQAEMAFIYQRAQRLSRLITRRVKKEIMKRARTYNGTCALYVSIIFGYMYTVEISPIYGCSNEDTT